jgi:hypothetical protein
MGKGCQGEPLSSKLRLDARRNNPLPIGTPPVFVEPPKFAKTPQMPHPKSQ